MPENVLTLKFLLKYQVSTLFRFNNTTFFDNFSKFHEVVLRYTLILEFEKSKAKNLQIIFKVRLKWILLCLKYIVFQFTMQKNHFRGIHVEFRTF